MNKLLVILLDDFQDIELTTFLSLVKKAQIFNQISFYNPKNTTVSGQFGIVKIEAQNHWQSSDFDAVFVPGGKAVQSLRTDQKTLNLINDFFENNKYVFAICDAPNALYEQNIAKNLKFSSYPIENSQNYQNRVEDKVYKTGNYFSARNADSATELAILVIEHLDSKEKAQLIFDQHQA